MSDHPLHLLLHPRSIATAGAGNNPLKMGTLQALSLLKDGWQGAFYPVHPKEKTVLGHKAYASPLDLPEAPDLALIVVPTDQVIPVFTDFARIGTKRAIVISGGFKETGAAGRQREERLNEIARASGMRFLGPNCVGFLNSQIGLNVTVFTMKQLPGPLGMASQSGTYITQTLAYLKEKGIRFSKAVSCGNEANIDICDVLEYLGQDEQTRAIILYIEGIRDGRRFIETAQRITPHKPVLAQYVGGSAGGAKAGMSHTGALAGPDRLYEGIFRQAGIIRCDTIEELYAHGWAHATQPPIRGNKLAVVTNSGGPGTAICHTADQAGMQIPAFSAALQAQIRPLIQSHANGANPVDLTFDLDMQALTAKIPGLILESGEVDGLILHGAMNSGFMKEIFPHVRELLGNLSEEAFLQKTGMDLSASLALPAKYGLPFIVSSFFGREDSNTGLYLEHDIPVFDMPEKAALGMATLLRHKEIRERKPIAREPLPATPPAAARIIGAALSEGQKALDEHQAKELLAAYGLPVTREGIARTDAEAKALARDLGFPVVAKACTWEIMHKSGQGLVALNLATEAELGAAFRAIQAAAGRPVPVLVQQMVKGAREFVAGMTRFPAFGPCILFGLGGIFTEAYGDAAFRSAPLSAAEAEEMLDQLRAKALLGEIRGLAAVDRSGLVAILRTLGQIALLHPEIAEIDLNPVMIAGPCPVIADALFVLKKP